MGALLPRLSRVADLLIHTALVLRLRDAVARGDIHLGALQRHLGEQMQTIEDLQRPAISSVRATSHGVVWVEYLGGGMEMIVFDATSQMVVEVQYFGAPVDAPACNAASVPNADGSKNDAIQLLALSTTWLEADLTGDEEQQLKLLDTNARAFGEVGAESVVRGNLDMAASGVSYALPYPLLIDTMNHCVVIDFDVFGGDGARSGRGTDVMYFDVGGTGRLLKLDTLRHVLEQPDWVKQHFS